MFDLDITMPPAHVTTTPREAVTTPRANIYSPMHNEVIGQPPLIMCNDMTTIAEFESGSKGDNFGRKTKIVCTMGPACWDVDKIIQLIDAGMNVARLNFSHGDHEAHGKTVANIRAACKERPEKYVAIMLDTKGPEIRTGFLQDKSGVELVKDSELILTTEDYDNFLGDASKIAVTYDKLPQSVKEGSVILAADGQLVLRVKEVGDTWVKTIVGNSMKLGERKNMNLPGITVDLPVLQEKDKTDLVRFGIPQGVDFIAASFVQSAEDVTFIRETLGVRGRQIKIISKIENEAGMHNFDEILKVTDAVMVARGDLGMEIPPEKVFLAQKMMIAKCNLAGKPVITATQMMESMIKNPRPTRAEASDVANAILDGTDAVMLSGETANGSFGVDCVTIMRKICEEAEKSINYVNLFESRRAENSRRLATAKVDIVDSVCCAGVMTAIDVKSPFILALTETGYTARLLAKYRPPQTIVAVTASETSARQLQIVRGVIPMLTASFQGTQSVVNRALAKGKEEGITSPGDNIICMHGQHEECPGQTNTLKVIPVP